MELKCKYCGASLSINDEKCPNCGRTNNQTAGHVADMKKYKSKEENITKEVHKSSVKSIELLSRGVVLSGLIVILIIIVVVDIKRSDYYENRMVNEAYNNSDEVIKTMMNYWNDGEYYKFYAYCEKYDIESRTDAPAEPFLKYRPLMNAAQCYGYINGDIILSCLNDNNHRKLENISSACALLTEFYSDVHMGNTFDDESVKKENDQYLSKIREDMGNILKSFFYLTDDDIDDISTMTEEDILITIEERVEQHENR